ncbi:MAG: VacB/RNase II family 3'-5' exoribonuclease [Akkermansiaceae bacterium]|jgi:ribonuclease R|nr:VacB/RNase II family 3'-5' exoribonuclease [Akkermansiaceae bacterium]MDP4647503.1 VacB/RNase II family 3'-5' exoribonuclease [Akkermansiaceae bacterium]MDP4778614.1 VacB/RNase II family 3'-5' exoribonuclease [Akkermansiaceae bacterium]MDP4848337.1 VacB/RNase II family 3'-5' exoribonuclease [Akkermansiaceae bacterium]MDP4899207.1 VacB/RNase II family 3'-5' exoribonuclease [Akkermansiaceae bacterium]
MRETILDLLRQNPEQTFSKTQIAKQLDIPGNRKGELGGVLSDLAEDNLIHIGAKNLYSFPKPPKEKKAPAAANKPAAKTPAKAPSGDAPKGSLTGSIKFLPNGHAFFYPIIGDPENEASGIDFTVHSRIFVPRDKTETALDGDSVRILPSAPSSKPRQRGAAPDDQEMRGKVLEVISRRSGRIVGIFRRKNKFAWVETDDKALEGGRINITGDTTAEPGQTVVADLVSWDNPSTDPIGHIIEVLGWPGDAGVDILSTIARYGLRTSFPEDVLREARAVPEFPDEKEIARRMDHRSKLVITIDPADAKDHDDAIYIAKTKSGGWLLEVHIADVSHYIKPGSPMDKEAVERGNSTYLVDRVLPMLPVELSNGICSLKPDVDRLTKCAVIEVSKEGHILNTKFIDAVIHSRAKLSYEQAQAILDGKGAPEGSDPTLVGSVKEAWKMASLLRKNRFANGALDLEMTEIKIKLDENGRACEAHEVVHTESHQLVEECMLIANQSVAKLLRERSKPSIFRIHEDPDPSRLDDYTETAKQYGYSPGDLNNRAHIQALLDAAKGTAEEHQIKLGLLKSLKRAAYAADPVGHYGLAKTDYTHFTSPIRRYADLIVHRSMQPFLENAPKSPDRTPSQADLRDIARHISDTERTSSEAESETKQIKLLEYLELIALTDQSKNQGEETTFDGVITDVRAMGLMVEIPDMGVRGVVKREDLPSSSKWRFEDHNKAWTSFDGKRLALGMKLPLRIVAIDKIKRFVDFAVAGAPTTEGVKISGKSPAKKGGRPPAKSNTRGSKKPTPKPAAKSGPSRGRGSSRKRR